MADLALKNRIATIHGQIQFAEAGAMIVYGPNDADMYRRAATYVDKILKGLSPPSYRSSGPSSLTSSSTSRPLSRSV